MQLFPALEKPDALHRDSNGEKTCAKVSRTLSWAHC